MFLMGGQLRFSFTGSVLVLKKEEIAGKQAKYLDMTQADYHDAIDYLTAWAVLEDHYDKWIAHWAFRPSYSGTKAAYLRSEGVQAMTNSGP